MQFIRQNDVSEILPRLILIVLGAVAVEPWRSSPPLPVTILAVAYLILTLGLWAGRRRLSTDTYAYAGLGLDVVGVSLLVAVARPSILPLWILYLLPLIATTPVGRFSLAVATGLSVVGMLLVAGLTDSLTVTAVGWPIVVLVAAALVLAITAPTMNAERSELRALRQAKSTFDALAHAQTLRETRQELHQMRKILDALPAPVVVWDWEGKCVLANVAYQALRLEGMPPTEAFTGDVWEEERVVGDPPRIFEVTRVPFRDEQFVVDFHREVTREREALRAKDDLIAVIGHELRNPLTSIHGYSQMMARQLGVVQEQVDRLNRMIADFMVAARLEGGKLPMNREIVDLVALARGAAERFRGASQGRPLRLDLPDTAPVEGDSSRLGQVVDNLINNAAKYSPPDQEIVLTIERNPSGNELLLSVRDHGIGIDPEFLPHLFDRFYRAPNSETQQVKGLGLGLSIVRDLVVAHGGRVWAESGGTGQGSTFWVSLPMASGSREGDPSYR